MAWELFPNPKSLDNEVISQQDLKAFDDKRHAGTVPPETSVERGRRLERTGESVDPDRNTVFPAADQRRLGYYGDHPDDKEGTPF